MLVEFSVENFKSFGEMQTLYMQPASTRNSERFVLDTGIESEPYVMPVVAVLGPNASGKSSLIHALNYLIRIVQDSSERKKTSVFEDKRFKLNPKYEDRPTRFLISLVAKDNALYRYELALFPDQIVEEKLLKTEEGSDVEEVLIERGVNSETVLSSSIHPDESFLRVWRADINDQKAFLSYLGNKGGVSLFDPLLTWFADLLYIPDSLPSFLTSKLLFDDLKAQEEVCDFVNDADIHIDKMVVEEDKQPLPEAFTSYFTEKFTNELGHEDPDIVDFLQASRSLNVSFYHKSTDGKSVLFDFESDESKGTRAYYALSGVLLTILKYGEVLVVDELENSLHPYLLRRIVQLFTNPETNPNGAQLIFTTHDVTVMDKTLLNPDQIYFTEKDKETYETSLVNLIDYKSIGAVGKKDRGKDLYKYYLEGRFGAVPEVNWG